MSFATASRTYYPGHLIYMEKAFARVLPRKDRGDHCEFCCKRSEDLISCPECSLVKYCGMECQAKDSSDHGIECENMVKLIGCLYEDFVRLLGRVIYKIKDKDWKTITQDVLGAEVSFEDIDSHYEEMTSNPKLILMCKGLKKSLENFIGEEILPDEKDLIKIIGKVKFSSSNFGIKFPNEFFWGMSKFEHQCIPNSNLEIHNNTLKIWAIRNISKSEKVTISLRTVLSSDIMRSPINEDCLEVCRCTECSLPYGESILTKILDEEKAYEVIKFSEKIINMAHVLSRLDMEKNSTLKLLVDKALQKHIGVLGPTNALHLKLLATKVMTLDDEDVQKKMYLIELEKNMKAAFGEFYIELHDIYKGLVSLCLASASPLSSTSLMESAYYLKLLKPLQMHRPKEE